jgi:hypothetical protein
MLASKLFVPGPIARVEPDRIIVRRGDVTDIYNPKYYRIQPEVEHGPIQRAADPAREAGTGRD